MAMLGFFLLFIISTFKGFILFIYILSLISNPKEGVPHKRDYIM